MIVGKLLKEKYGFDKQETIDRFIDQFGYSELIVNKILDDAFPVLLTCHIQDFALFTNASEDELYDAQELPEVVDPLRPSTPMGKQYHPLSPIHVKLEILERNPVDEKQKNKTHLH